MTNRDNLRIYVSIILLILVNSLNSYGYDDERSHPAITLRAIEASNLEQYLTNNYGNQFEEGWESFVYGETIRVWLSRGSQEEDNPLCRASNHFHDPLKLWNESYLTDFPPVQASCSIRGWSNTYSNVTWATGYLSQPNNPPSSEQKATFPYSDKAPYTWDSARWNYYNALLSPYPDTREAYFARTFQAIGQVMHLLQDMAVPAHVRNDFQSHLIGSGLENWANNLTSPTKWVNNPFEFYVKKNTNLITKPTNTLSIANLRVTDFWDTDGNSSIMGLAESTNMNYLSDSTIPNNLLNAGGPLQSMLNMAQYAVHYYPNPTIDSNNLHICLDIAPGVSKPRKYLSRNAYSCPPPGYDRNADHFAALSFWSDIASAMLPESIVIPRAGLYIDDNVHKTYAKELLPLAVEYSAGLLDYFFRGTLYLFWPETGVYSLADGSKTREDANGNQQQEFTTIKVAIFNTTPNEAVGPGALTAVARYKIIPNYAPDLSNYPPDELTMKAVTYSYSVSRTITVTEQEASYLNQGNAQVTFEFDEHPIPAGITDLTLQVVFKGTIGNEIDNAIAVGMKDLMEPTHLTIWNLSDMFSLQYPGTEYQLYTFEELQGMALPGSSLLNWLDITPAPNGNDSLADELYLQPSDSTYTLSFWNGTAMVPALTVPIPAGGHIRPIVLTGQTTNNWYELKWEDPVEPGSVTLSFPGVVNQADPESGEYKDPTPVHEFRKGPQDGPSYVPIRSHAYAGIVGCKPDTGDISCPYPDEEANGVSLTPVPFTSIFDQQQ